MADAQANDTKTVAPTVTEELTPEEKELKELSTQFTDAPRFRRWRELYFDKSNTQTYLNKQESAIIAYGFDPKDPAQRQLASEYGFKNARKCKNWARDYLAEKGMTQERWLELTTTKALTTNNAKYVEILGSILEVYDPKAPTVNVTNNTQNNTQINVNGQEAEDFNAKFKEWINSQ